MQVWEYLSESKGSWLELLLVLHRQLRFFSDADVGMLGQIADQAAVAIKSARQYQVLERRSAHFNALYESSKVLTQMGTTMNRIASEATNQQEILDRILEQAVKSVTPHQLRKMTLGTIQLYNSADDTAMVTGVCSIPSDVVHLAKGTSRNLRARAARGECIGVTGRAILDGKSQFVPDVRENSDFLPCCQETRSEIAVPIMEGTRVLGAISLESDLVSAFDRADLKNLELMAELAVATIQRARDSANLSEAYRELKLADERKTWFLTVLSHELRVPLASVRLFIEAILKNSYGFLPTSLRQGAEEALDRINEETGLIENLLDMVKIREGRLVLSVSSVDMGGLLKHVHETFQRIANRKQVKLSLSIPKDNLVVALDESKIKQVLNNLVANAVQFTDAGGSVHICTKRQNDSILVSVRDTGRGIPIEARDRLFQRFFQVDHRDSMRGGLGLGLTIVQEYVDLHGGQISVESTVGKGSSFVVSLPVRLDMQPHEEKTLPGPTSRV